ncbi:MAG TPA: electron transfer flavoprotein subunit alpha [Firmicutes bacterium]|nr:electron transfer flavoprotein subunit alpha [Candidatus Fermentithermobacillaceae bacterium]
MSRIVVNPSLCDRCGECVAACPFGALSLRNDTVDVSDQCRLCLVCTRRCPRGAILLVKEKADGAGVSDVRTGVTGMRAGATKVEIRRDSARGIMVFAEYHGGRFEPVTYELIGKALELAAKVGDNVVCVAAGESVLEPARELLHYGVDKVLVYDAPELRYFVAPAYTEILEDAIRRVKPGVLLIGATPLGRSLAPRVAVRFRTGLTADCTILDIRPDGELVQTRPAFGGNIMATIVTRETRPQMATVRYKVMKRAERRPVPSGDLEEVTLSGSPGGTLARIREHLNRIKVISDSPLPKTESIADAEVIVAVGRGVRSDKDLPMFERLAERLGGVLACSRPLVEKGWFPASRQVGLSGRTVRPKLYIACGISGAIQHAAGMSESEVIIAINQDRNAQIFDVAHYGIVGDMYEIVPELLRLLDA